jgi:hypothetical protein
MVPTVYAASDRTRTTSLKMRPSSNLREELYQVQPHSSQSHKGRELWIIPALRGQECFTTVIVKASFFLHVKRSAVLPNISSVTSQKRAGVTIPALVHKIPVAMTDFQNKHNMEDQGILVYYAA